MINTAHAADRLVETHINLRVGKVIGGDGEQLNAQLVSDMLCKLGWARPDTSLSRLSLDTCIPVMESSLSVLPRGGDFAGQRLNPGSAVTSTAGKPKMAEA